METTPKYDWDFIMTDNDYNIAQKLLEVYENKDFAELGKALKYYLSNSISSAKIEVYEVLTELMFIIVMWKNDTKLRTQENWEKIVRFRDEIDELKEDYDFVDTAFVMNEWEEALDTALSMCEAYIKNTEQYKAITITEIFEENLKAEYDV